MPVCGESCCVHFISVYCSKVGNLLFFCTPHIEAVALSKTLVSVYQIKRQHSTYYCILKVSEIETVQLQLLLSMFQLTSSILFLKGRVYEAMDNRGLAADCYKQALRCDVHCYEAFEALVQHQMLSAQEGNTATARNNSWICCTVFDQTNCTVSFFMFCWPCISI